MNQRSKILAQLCCVAVFSGAVGSSAAQTTAGVPVIVDARNTVVGPAFGQATPPGYEGVGGVIVSVQGIPVYVDLANSADGVNYCPTDLRWGAAYTQIFPTADCSGPPLISARPLLNNIGQAGGYTHTPFRPAVVVRNGNTVALYVAGTSAPTNQAFRSIKYAGSICQQQNPAFSYSTLAYSVGITVNDLTQLHPEPLHVR
jgi:hypothetical protein